MKIYLSITAKGLLLSNYLSYLSNDYYSPKQTNPRFEYINCESSNSFITPPARNFLIDRNMVSDCPFYYVSIDFIQGHRLSKISQKDLLKKECSKGFCAP